MTSSSKLISNFSNLLLVVGFCGLVILISPYVIEEISFRFNISKQEQVDSSYAIAIPSQGIKSPIVIDIDPFNQSEYQFALRFGVAHASNTALPGTTGTSFLFAHSSANPWELAITNTPFMRLERVNNGDFIIISTPDGDLTYQITDQKIVLPSEAEYLLNPSNTESSQLIIQTCTPLGTDWRRLLVFATLVHTNG